MVAIFLEWYQDLANVFLVSKLLKIKTILAKL